MKTQANQFIRYFVVGAINITVDLGVFNILIAIFGMAGGANFLLFKSVSFLVAAANSFLFNGMWKFKELGKPEVGFSPQAPSFIAVNIFGLIVNTTVAYYIFKIGSKFLLDIPIHNMANGGAVVGILAVAISNVICYKLFVFKTHSPKAALQGHKKLVPLQKLTLAQHQS